MIEKAEIEQCMKGDLKTFGTIITKISPMVYTVAFRILGDGEEARDIVQETMISVWYKMKEIKVPGNFRKWVYRITVNKCLDCLRKRKRTSEFRMNDKGWELLSDQLGREESTELDNSEMETIISHLTSKLSPKQKIVFVLSELEELPNDEIINITGMSNTLIKANLYHARKKMQELLQKIDKHER